jgi:hypothetical protein
MWAKSLVRRKRHFFTSAVQFVTTVSGAFGSISTSALIKLTFYIVKCNVD